MVQELNGLFGKVQSEILTHIRNGEHHSYFNKTQLVEGYKKQVSPILMDCYNSAIQNGKDLINPNNPHKGTLPAISNPNLYNWLVLRINWAAEEIGRTLERDLSASLSEGYTAGESMQDLSDRVNIFFDDPIRSMRIARTETIATSAQGALAGYLEAGATQVKFWAAADERSCDYCMEYHDQIFDIGQEMPIPLHPNCRCVFLPVVETMS